MTDPAAVERLLTDDESLVLIVGALGEYRSLLRDNHETAVSAEERAYFVQQIAMVNEILRSLRVEDSQNR